MVLYGVLAKELANVKTAVVDAIMGTNSPMRSLAVAMLVCSKFILALSLWSWSGE